MGSGGKGSSGNTTVRYAPYLEKAHQALIALSLTEEQRLMGLGTTPWDGLSYSDVDTAFFGAGLVISSFPSLWDMFGKFVAGLDIEALYAQIYDDMVNGVVTNSVITNEAIALQDDIDQVAVPRLNAGLRDINAFFSDSFMDGKALLQATKLKQINKFAADVKIKAMDLALQRWSQHLHWNPQVVEQYKSMNQLYWATKVDLNNAIGELNSKVALWNYTIMDHHRAIVATLNGAAAASIKGESKWQSILGGVMGTTSLMGQLGMFGSPAASQAIPGAAAGLSGAAAGTGFGAAMPAIGSVAAQGAGPIGLSGIASMFTSFLAFL